MSEEYFHGERGRDPDHPRERFGQGKMARALTHQNAIDAHTYTEKQIVFIESYCTWFDTARAARDAGIAITYGYKLLKYKPIKDAIWERVQHEKASPHEIVQRVMDIARGDIGRLLTVEEHTTEEGKEYRTYKFDLSRALIENMTYAIKTIEFDRLGNVKKVVMEDKLQALELVGRAFGVFPREPDVKDDRDFVQRARDMGLDPVRVAVEMGRMAKQLGVGITIDNETQEEVSVESDAATVQS